MVNRLSSLGLSIALSAAVGCSSVKEPVLASRESGGEAPHFASMAMADPPQAKFDLLTAKLECGSSDLTPHSQLICHLLYHNILQEAGSTTDYPAREYDVYLGSIKDGKDGSGSFRGIASATKEKCSKPGNNLEMGEAICLTNGFALVSGRAPMIMARRVRAVSDGTQFAIEIDRAGVTRVYLLHMPPPSQESPNPPERLLRVAPDLTGAAEATFGYRDIGKYVEITLNNRFAQGKDKPVAPAADSKEKYFLDQMNLLRACLKLPMDRAMNMLEWNDKPDPKYETLMERFNRQCAGEP